MKKVVNLIVTVCLIITLLPNMNIKVSAATGSDVVAEAMVHVNQGDQYVWGTSGPDTFDCSGFVSYVFKQFGITLSNTAKNYSHTGTGTSHSYGTISYGTIITDTSQLQSGDILCFGSSSSSIGHVGIYDANGGYIIHALNSDKDLLRSPTLSTWISSPGWNSNGNNQFRHAIRINLSGSVGKTIVNPVNVSGKNATVSWGAVSNASYYSVYLIQSPWGWNDVKYSTTTTSTSQTFNNVTPGYYQAFVIARPNTDYVQSNWVEFTVSNQQPYNPWISVNNGNNITVTPGSNVTLKYGADNATNYLLGIDRDGVRIETLDRTGTSEYTRSYEIGNYSAYISAGNSGGYVDSTRVNFTVAEKDYIPTKTISYNNKVYALYDYKTSWNVANDIANKIGGHLATIGSAEEQNKVVELMSFGNKDSYWLGGTDSATEGIWTWIDGTPWNYTSWASGEPNNAVYLDQKENYLQAYKNGVWNDLPKIAYEASSIGFIVEIENYLSPIATNVYNKNTYMLFDYDMTWTEANEYCKLLGGHLATISDANEQTAIESLVSKGAWNLYYLGASDRVIEGTWFWIDGTPWDYTNWNTSQPDDYQGVEDYLQIYNSNKKWNDLYNYHPTENTGFVCEIPFSETPTAQITNGTSSYLLFDQYLSWEDAKIYCENLGGHLVTITSQEEQNAVYNLAMQGGKNQYWLGANYGTTNSWNWVTGESFPSYSNWDIAQPDNIGGENYLQMYKIPNPYNASSQAGKWNNTYVNNFRSGEAFFGIDKIGFICEFDTLNSYTKANGFWFDIIVIASAGEETAKLEFYNDENYIDQRTFQLSTGINKLSLTAIGAGANKVKMYKNDELLLTRALNAYDESLTYGDVDGDNEVTSGDALSISRHFNGIEVITDNNKLKIADVNGDGKINKNDADLLRNYVVEIISRLPIQESLAIYDANAKYGDVTGDNLILINDLAKIYQHLSGTNIIVDVKILQKGDVNGDGEITQADLDMLSKYLIGEITVFPIEMQVSLNLPLVTFDTQGGSEIPSIDVSYNTQLTRPTNPTKAGYIFENWYSDSSFTNAFDFNMPVTADITLFARWIPLNITIANLFTTKYNDTYKVMAEIQNDNQAKMNVPVYIALYSESGKLLRLRNININIDAAATVNISEDFSGAFECETVKIFIWKSTYTMQPITQRKSCLVQLNTIVPNTVTSSQ